MWSNGPRRNIQLQIDELSDQLNTLCVDLQNLSKQREEHTLLDQCGPNERHQFDQNGNTMYVGAQCTGTSDW